ncbi:MAG TPA: hypothetical protein VEG38_05780 [Acidimicrobiia bacterium]|nr:hypothetical protein [Acidimicrobiia bacterium]
MAHTSATRMATGGQVVAAPQELRNALAAVRGTAEFGLRRASRAEGRRLPGAIKKAKAEVRRLHLVQQLAATSGHTVVLGQAPCVPDRRRSEVLTEAAVGGARGAGRRA